MHRKCRVLFFNEGEGETKYKESSSYCIFVENIERQGFYLKIGFWVGEFGGLEIKTGVF